jgi:hypothetical protein
MSDSIWSLGRATPPVLVVVLVLEWGSAGWSRKCGQVLLVCYPEGINDRSQVIYCLERVPTGQKPPTPGHIFIDSTSQARHTVFEDEDDYEGRGTPSPRPGFWLLAPGSCLLDCTLTPRSAFL